MLGIKLREAIAKLTGRPYVDEAAVKSLIKDLQRILLASDVNVKLVFELSKRIEEKALKTEKKDALTLKEHIVKVVYDELVHLMGESYAPKIDKHKVLLCGLYGSGKCIHKDSLVPLADGRIKTIEDIYKEFTILGEESLEDGFKIECKDKGPEIYAFNKETLKIEKRKASVLWKLKKNSKLLKIILDNGNDHSIIVTPEHPFFILDHGEIKQIRADQLRKDLYIATAMYLDFSGDLQRLDNIIIDKFDDLVIKNLVLSSSIKTMLIKEFGTLKNAYNTLKIKQAYCTFTTNLKHGFVPIYLLKKILKTGFHFDFPNQIIIKSSKTTIGDYAGREIKFPLILNNELAEFLGYVYGDGYIYKGYVEITNNEKEILARLKNLSQKLFGKKGKIKIDKRNGVKKIVIYSKLLVKLLNKIFELPIGKKSHTMKIPDILLKSPNHILKSFIRAYFDTDGYVALDQRSIEFCSASRFFIQQLQLIFLRYRIYSSISRKSVNGQSYYRLFLKGNDVNKFKTEFSSILPLKKIRLNKLSKITGQGPGKHYLIPAGELLKKAREAYGLSIGEVQNFLFSYGIYEKNGRISRNSLNKFLSILTKPHKNWLSLLCKIQKRQNYKTIINEQQQWATASLYRLQQQGYISKINDEYYLTDVGNEVLKLSNTFDTKKIDFLTALAFSDICWIKIKKIEEIDEEQYVFDLTVDDLHTFVANGIIVHNTTTVAKLAKFYKNRGLSVLLVGADVDRPAAQEQLQQLAEKVGANFYAAKTDAASIVKAALENAKEDVVIVDSAGRNAFDEQLAKELRAVYDALKPDEVFLVITADIGQVAGKQAAEFNKIVPISGVIVTRMDGSGKGGGALSAVAATGAKIAFIGVGEKLDDLEVYKPEKFVGRLLGMPDIETLLEKIKQVTKEEELKKIESEGLTIETFYEQLKAAKKLGPLGNVFSMLGVNNLPKEVVQQSEEKMKKYEAMINSMTKSERKNPKLIRGSKSRIARIAKGSGCTENEVREFLSQFEKVEKMMEKFKKDRGFRSKIEKMMKGMPPGMI